MSPPRLLRLAGFALALVVPALLIHRASQYGFGLRASAYPVFVCGLLLVLIAIHIAVTLLRERSAHPPAGAGPEIAASRMLVPAGWILGYAVAMAVIGYVAASAIFLAAYFYLAARLSILRTAVTTVVVVGSVVWVGTLFNFVWP